MVVVPNRLAAETSPYLLEHANNPVDWYPWGDQALARARAEDKPILLSVGYSACHWCHVMARESFEDPEVAALMNRYFVSIKVDREERPDLDQVYMRAVQGMTGSGGWPMTVFLTPDGVPFYGGTYFPPTERLGMPSFRRVLTGVAEAYRLRKTEVLRTAEQVRAYVAQTGLERTRRATLSPQLLDAAYERFSSAYDSTFGGFGQAPKFPQPMVLDVLLRHARRTGAATAKDMASATLQAMAGGGLYDQLGGGFHRYSVDAHWLVPHFEKMLYDNALLTRSYVEAWQLTGEPAFRRVAEETLDFVTREMTAPSGGFYSTLDADSEGEEGRYYTWTVQELDQVLGPKDAGRVAHALDVTAAGNFEGRNILHIVSPDAPAVMASVRPRLMAARDRRVRPHRDEKVLASWNGLMLRGVAEAGLAFGRDDLLGLGRANARFLLAQMRRDDRMLRSSKDGQAGLPGYLEDQAAVADGLFSLYQATFEREWIVAIHGLLEEMLRAFYDEGSGMFYDTAKDHERLIVRPQDVTDNATPSGSSLAVDILLRAGRWFDNEQWTEAAVRVLERLGPLAAQAPTGFGRLLAALDFHVGRPLELALIGDPQAPDFRALVDVIRSRYLPNRLVAQTGSGEDSLDTPLLRGRGRKDGRATAYLCKGFICQAPTTDPHELLVQIEEALQPSSPRPAGN